MSSKSKNRILVMPYTIWMIGFIIIPLIFVVCYGLTNNNNAFTIENVMSFFNPIH